LIDVKKCIGKTLRFFPIITVGLPREFPLGSDGRDIFKVFGDLPIEIKVRENSLSPSGDSLLGKFEDHHLSQLFQFLVRHPDHIGGEKKIDGVPTDCSSKMTLKGGRKFHHMGKQDFWMFGRLGHGDRVGKAQAKALDVFERLTAAVRPIDKTQVVEMEITTHMGIGNFLREDRKQGIFLLDPLR